MSKKDNLYAVILAGGRGTRFWPLSRQKIPKQFLRIIDRHTLFEETLTRIKSKIAGQNIFIVTNKNYAKEIRKESRGFGIPKTNILLEPTGKNTASAIAWASFCIQDINPQATTVVLPSDHLILNKNVFLESLEEAIRQAKRGRLVTFGIVPSYPETGYGYIKAGRSLKSNQALAVQGFIEKPSSAKVKKFLKERKYLWNSGMFVWRVDDILKEFKKFLPRIFYFLKNHHTPAKIERVWPKLESISIDYGILQKTKNITTICCLDMGWSDLGSWEALYKILRKNKQGNALKGNIIDFDSRQTLIFGDRRLVVAMGLDNLIIVDTPDALLVCRRDLAQKVRDITALLKNKKNSRYL